MNYSKTLRIVFTDSGFGGLSILGTLYEWLRSKSKLPPVDLIFASALPETGKGYNSMSNTTEKISTFNKFLYSIENHFQPDLIAIACNTLSVLASQTEYYQEFMEKIVGVVEIGIQSFVKSQPIPEKSYIIILGTETTIESDVHRRKLIDYAVPSQSITPQSCPKLASAIEFDFMSQRTKQIVLNCVKEIGYKIPQKNSGLLIYLACTHYGYIANIITEAFQEFGYHNFVIVNPNNFMAQAIKEHIERLLKLSKSVENLKPKLQIFSRCEVLPEEIASISKLINPISRDTAKALKGYELKKDLF